MHCNQCGLEVPDNYKFCPKCGSEQQGSTSPVRPKKEYRYNKWCYALPIFLGIFGGLFEYFVLRKKDPKTARNCLIVGFIVSIILITIQVLIQSS